MLSTARFINPFEGVDLKRTGPESGQVAGFIHSYETGSSIDGPGVRFVVFTTGCPLACRYCHNPDTRKVGGGNRTLASDVLEEIRSMRVYLRNGGVTLSGGEPLCQPRLTHAILKGAKAMGIHTTLDTSGFLGSRVDDEMLESIDLVLLDIKSGDEATYKHVTGRSLEPTLRFAQRLDEKRKPVWIRFVLVPGLTDGEDNIRKVARICKGLSNVERVEILPFHKMGELKYHELQMAYDLTDTPEANGDDIIRAIDIFEEEGVYTQ